MPEEIIDKYREPVEGDPEAMEEDLGVSKPAEQPAAQEKLEQDSVVEAEQLSDQLKKEKPIESEKTLDKEVSQAKEVAQTDSLSGDGEDKSGDDNNNLKREAHRISQLSRPEQVKALCDLAFQKGIDFAAETAKEMNNPSLLDEFHDTLVDDFREKLKDLK